RPAGRSSTADGGCGWPHPGRSVRGRCFAAAGSTRPTAAHLQIERRERRPLDTLGVVIPVPPCAGFIEFISITRSRRSVFMISYVTLGTNDLTRASHFYDELLAILGAKRGWETEKYVAWTTAPSAPMLLVIKPNDGKRATVGNGVMVSLAANSKTQVAAV